MSALKLQLQSGFLRGSRGLLKVFSKHLGPRLYVVFFLTMVAALTEGLGIALLLPLFANLDPSLSLAGVTPEPLTRLVKLIGADQSLLRMTCLVAGVFILKGLIAFTYQAYSGYLRAHLMRELRSRLFNLSSTMDYGYYTTRSSPHFVNVITAQVNSIYLAFSGFTSFYVRAIQAATYLLIAFLTAWLFGVLAVIAGLLFFFALRSLNDYVRGLSRKASSEASRLNKMLVQSMQAFKYLVATGKMHEATVEVDRSVGELAENQKRLELWQSFVAAITEPISVMLILGLIVVQVGLLGAPLGPILVAILLFHRGMGALLSLQGAWQSTLAHVGAVEMVENEMRLLEANQEVNGSVAIGPLRKSIVLDNVSFAYDPRLGNAVDALSLTVPALSSIAIVGASGAGKSTIIDLLTLMLKPQTGSIRIDGIAGTEIDAAGWRRQIGFVSQEAVVFDESIAANIAMVNSDTAISAELLERIRRAAKKAHLEEFIDSLPDGYQTRVGERGVMLSGGQRQRLFIARELMKQPSLLILDEATSALDSASEREIQKSIDDLRGAVTVVVIAHRLSTIRNVDLVYVLERGRIVESGQYEELRSRTGSRFGAMIEMQAA